MSHASSRRPLVPALLVAAGAVVGACNALTGVDSLHRDTEGGCIDGTEAACLNGTGDGGDPLLDTGRGDANIIDPACGKDCLGGTCTDGVCQPVLLALAQDQPVGIAVDGKRVYWANRGSALGSGSVQTTLLDGADKRELVNMQPSAGFVALDDTWVYLSNQGSPPAYADGRIVRIRKDGTGLDRIYDNQLAPLGIAIDTTSVYWTNALTGEIFKARLDGKETPFALASKNPYTFGIAADDSRVFWTRYDGVDTAVGEVVTSLPDGGDPKTLATAQERPRGIAIDATRVYWVNEIGGTVMSCDRRLGALPTVLAQDQDKPFTVVLDDTSISWVNQGTNPGSGSVMRMPRDGCTKAPSNGVVDAATECPQVLAVNQSRPYGIAVDRSAVYWTNIASGNVFRVAK